MLCFSITLFYAGHRPCPSVEPPTPIESVVATLQSLLGYRFRAVWPLSLRVVDAGLEAVGQHTAALGGPRVLAALLQACVCVCVCLVGCPVILTQKSCFVSITWRYFFGARVKTRSLTHLYFSVLCFVCVGCAAAGAGHGARRRRADGGSHAALAGIVACVVHHARRL